MGFKDIASLWCLLIFFLMPTALFADSPLDQVKIGVLAKRGPAICMKKWGPTARYLTNKIPNKKFVILPIAFEQIYAFVENRKVDFILANSSFYVGLEHWYGANRIVTLKNLRLEGAYTKFAGVILWKANRAGFRELNDLKGKTFMAVKETSFGGWQMAWREFKEQGIDPYHHFKALSFGGTHDAVVLAVRDGIVDAGTVRTDTLERMQAEGQIDVKDFYVMPYHGKKVTNLPFLHSTRAYPEWPMAKIKHTPDALAQKVAVALLEMKADSDAAKAGQCAGWTIPLNYQAVHECLKELKIGPYKDLGKITFLDVVRHYWYWILVFSALFFVMAGFMAVILKLNKNINISRRKLTSEVEERKKAEKAAGAANRAKGEFLANMSHEIRTPMNAIIGLTYLAKQTDLTPQQYDYLVKIESSGESLLGVINDILDFSKIEAGRLTMESVEFYLEDVLGKVADMVSMKADEKGLELVFAPDSKVPEELVGDPLRLGQILINLVGNAIKFTEKGEVVIEARLLEDSGEQAVLKFDVRDTGMGMSGDQMQRLFQAFSQADTSTTRKFGGTGLGLVICKRLVDMMGGKITLESRPGKGSTFSFTAVLGRHDKKRKTPLLLAEDFKGMKALVVDDNRTARQTLKRILESFQFKVVVAGTGKEGLRILKASTKEGNGFDLVLVDWKMPLMDGMETARHIKNNLDLARIPTVIMVTAYGSEEILAQAEEVGLDGFVTKPASASTLLDSIMSALGKEMGFRIKGAFKPLRKAGGLDGIAGARILLAEDNEINQQVACELLKSVDFTVTVAANGQEALDLLQRNEFDAVLMDVQMPVMDGLSAAKKIRELTSEKSNIPIIAVTAHAMAGDREKSIQAGMNDHVNKPLDPEELLAVLVKWIKPIDRQLPEKTKRLKSKDVRLKNKISLPHLPQFDIKAALARLGGSRNAFVRLVNKFAVGHLNAVDDIAAGLKAGSTKKALKLTHTLKGVAGNIGAVDLHKLTIHLEQAIKKGMPKEIESQLDLTRNSLGQVLSAIKQINEITAKDMHSKIAAEQGHAPLDADKITFALAKMKQLLESKSFRAGQHLESLFELLKGIKVQKELNALEQLVTQYKFKGALVVIDSITKIFQASLQGKHS